MEVGQAAVLVEISDAVSKHILRTHFRTVLSCHFKTMFSVIFQVGTLYLTTSNLLWLCLLLKLDEASIHKIHSNKNMPFGALQPPNLDPRKSMEKPRMNTYLQSEHS